MGFALQVDDLHSRSGCMQLGGGKAGGKEEEQLFWRSQ